MIIRTLVGACVLGLTGTVGAQVVHLNELYISHAGTDDQEYVELIGQPGLSLANHMVLVVEGEGLAAGTLDQAFDLTGQTIPLDGYFVLGDTAVANVDLVVGTTNIIENGTETIYLVHTAKPSAISALVGTNITTGVGTTQIPSLATVLDSVGVADPDIGTLDTVFDGAFEIRSTVSMYRASASATVFDLAYLSKFILVGKMIVQRLVSAIASLGSIQTESTDSDPSWRPSWPAGVAAT